MRRIVLVLALATVSCATKQPELPPPQLASLAVQADDYSFDSPRRAEAGEVTVTLANAGKEPHQAQLFDLNEGVDVGDVVDSAKKDASGGGLLELGSFAGGPNAVGPGGSQVATLQLEKGRYAFICLVPDAKGRAHLGRGMVSGLTVAGSDEKPDSATHDQSSSAEEFDFDLPDRWEGRVEFEKRGEQPHELQVLGVAEGKAAEDVERWLRADPAEAGPPTWTANGGAAVISPNSSQTFDIDLAPGTYFATCFVLDPQEKKAHIALGMMKRFEVKEET